MIGDRELALLDKLSDVLEFGDQGKPLEIFDKVLRALQEYYDSDWCIIRQLDDTQTNLEIVGYTGLSNDEYLRLKKLTTDNWVYDKLVVQKESIKVNNLKRESPYNNEVYLDSNIVSFMASPVIVDNRVLGSIKVYSKQTKKWKQSDERILRIVANQLSMTLTSHNLLNRYREHSQSVTGSVLTLLDFKDKYTCGHSRKVANYSVLIADQLQLSPNEVRMIQIAAMLHDIGKIIVSDSILNKQGKLTDSEYAKMKEHPAMGSRVLESGGFGDYICRIVEQHHERWDGGGYPSGASRNDISLGARIVSVADAYEAMTSERTYHEIRSHHEAMIEIEECSGTQFCPTVAGAFLSIDEYLLSADIPQGLKKT